MTDDEPHPLDGVFARITRADENIRLLDARLTAFLRSSPPAFTTHLDETTGQFVHRARFVKNPGLWASVMVGEILFLLRSSLDHLVAQWLLPRTPAEERDAMLERCAFPIYFKGDWASFDWANKIPRATDELKAAIWGYQPINPTSTLPVLDHPLALLNAMHQIDKHRLLLVTVIKVEATAVPGPEFEGTIGEFEGGEYITGSSAVTGHFDAPLYTGQLDPEAGGLDMEFQSTTTVAFKAVGTRRGVPVLSTLRELSAYVHALASDFKLKLF